MRNLFGFMMPVLFLVSGINCYSLNFYDDEDPEVLARKIVDEMTDEELLGQIMMLGYTGTEPSEELLTWIKERQIGGVKIFGWNGTDSVQLPKTVSAYQKAAAGGRFGIPLIIATDQEGGTVRHITDKTTPTAGSMSLGSDGLPYDSYMTGYYIGRELRSLGINMNFAPDIDIYNHPDGSIMGTRCFSGDPYQTGILGLSFYKGQEDCAVISTAKHFPGHGNTSVNSHGKTPVIMSTPEEFYKTEMVPYRMLVKEGIPAIMVGHLSFPEITGNMEPATISTRLLTDLLKNDIGFKGMIISDDMLMYGVRLAGGGIPMLCLKSVEAGVDMILISRAPKTYYAIWDLLYETMKENPQFQARVKDAAYRVILTKLRYLKRADAVPLYPDRENPSEELQAAVSDSSRFFFDQACRSIAVVKNRDIPLDENEKKILLAGGYTNFINTGKCRFPKAETYKFPAEPVSSERQKAINDLKAAAGRYDVIIFCLSDEFDRQILEALKPYGNKIIVLSISTPLYLKDLPWIETAVAAYSSLETSFTAAFGVIAGDYEAEGIIPIPFFTSSR